MGRSRITDAFTEFISMWEERTGFALSYHHSHCLVPKSVVGRPWISKSSSLVRSLS